jgi:hypothetical protein
MDKSEVEEAERHYRIRERCDAHPVGDDEIAYTPAILGDT